MDINDHGYGSADMLDSLSDNDDFLMGHERGLKMPSWSTQRDLMIPNIRSEFVEQ